MSYTKEDLSCRQSWLILGYIRNYRIKQIGEVWIAWTECSVVVYRAVGINDDETRDARDAPVAAQFLILLFSACDKLCHCGLSFSSLFRHACLSLSMEMLTNCILSLSL